ncbi:MAG: T9SS type A sorting domain-containing protein [Flavobacteriaceae bacterium]|nr:T9SS type A sorting domain-containing protein [Flavobacteriaceae bacterium]
MNIGIDHLDFYDVNGRHVLHSNDKSRVDLSTLSQGFYFMQIVQDNGSITTKK